jgi:hypothetical protein
MAGKKPKHAEYYSYKAVVYETKNGGTIILSYP